MYAKIEFLVKFVKTHCVLIAVGMTATAFILVMMKNQKELNEFLTEHNLMDAFYAIEE